MPAVVAVVGASGSGKTTFIERLVPALQARGVRVGTIKHASHGFDADRPGSDSARHTVAGASPVLLVGPTEHALFRRNEPGGAEPLPVLVERYFTDTDLVLAEGYTTEPGPKVLVHRRVVVPRDPPPAGEVLFAVTDEPLGFEVEIPASDLARAVDLLVSRVGGIQTPHLARTGETS